MKYKTKQQILNERLPAIGNLSQWQKDMMDAMDEYALQEVNKISSKRDVIKSVCVHRWKYLTGTSQNETMKCIKCGAVG